jgi:hypothetical protein
MSEVTNNFYISGNYIAEQKIETQNIIYGQEGSCEHVNSIYPRKGKYQEVVEWLEKKKQKGEDLYAGCGYNRSELCRKLSKIFGWEVDESGLRKAEK